MVWKVKNASTVHSSNVLRFRGDSVTTFLVLLSEIQCVCVYK